VGGPNPPSETSLVVLVSTLHGLLPVEGFRGPEGGNPKRRTLSARGGRREGRCHVVV
jgi:hypothetical protein